MTSKVSLTAPFQLVLLLAIALVLLSNSVFARTNEPHFKDYPAGEIYTGKTTPIILSSRDKMFRTRLRWAAKNVKPNFAGHYILTTWGCGAECLMGAVIDAKTGKVYWWDFSICCWDFDTVDEPINFRLDSKLIIFSGTRNEKEHDNGAHFYKFEKGHFVHIRSIKQKQ